MPGKLSDYGRQQAEKLSKRLSQMNIDVIYSSNLKRSADTSKIIQKYVSCRIIYTESLREIYMGDYEGKKRPWDTKEEMEDFITNNRMNGESLKEIYERAKEFIEYIKKKHPNDTVLVFGHTAINQALLTAVKNEGLEKIFDQNKQKTTAVNIIEVSKNDCRITKLNCTEHLTH